MSRVSLVSRFNSTQRILLNKTEDLDETRRILASGNRVQEPSDDPTAMVNINSYSNQLDEIDQFKSNITSGRNNLENSEATMSQLSSVMQRVRELTVQANNDTLSKEDRESISSEIDERLEQVVNLANSEVAGKYLFSGTETTGEQPFNVERNGNGEIVDVSYNGDFNPTEAKTGEGEAVDKNILGSRLFQATNQGIEGGFEFRYAGESRKELASLVRYENVEASTTDQAITNPDPAENTGAGTKSSLAVSDAGQFQVGETVRVYKENGSSSPGSDGDQDYEETVVTGRDTTNNLVEVDLKNDYDVSSESVRIESNDTHVSQEVTAGGDSDGTVVDPGTNTSFGSDDAVTLSINNGSNIQTGDKIRIEDDTGQSEVRIVQNKPGTDQVDVDLANSYASGDNPTVRKVAEESPPTNGEGHFRIDDEQFYYNTREDSIHDIAQRINERGIEVEAKFSGREKGMDRTTLTTDANLSSSNPAEFTVADPSEYEIGQEVTLRDDNGNEATTTINEIDRTGDGTRIVADGQGVGTDFTVGNNATMEKATGEVEDYSASEVGSAADGPYRFKLESRVPHEIYLKDVDRQAETEQVEGLLSDLQFLGDGEGGDPDPRTEQNFPNPFSDQATVTGKSIFDAMIDTREAMQDPDDPDSGLVRKGAANDVGGAAKTRRRFDTPLRETLQGSLEDFSGAINNINAVRGQAGARLNRLESAEGRAKDLELSSNELLSELKDADLAKVISDLRRQEAVQQAALQMASRTLNQSLANFI